MCTCEVEACEDQSPEKLKSTLCLRFSTFPTTEQNTGFQAGGLKLTGKAKCISSRARGRKYLYRQMKSEQQS